MAYSKNKAWTEINRMLNELFDIEHCAPCTMCNVCGVCLMDKWMDKWVRNACGDIKGRLVRQITVYVLLYAYIAELLAENECRKC